MLLRQIDYRPQNIHRELQERYGRHVNDYRLTLERIRTLAQQALINEKVWGQISHELSTLLDTHETEPALTPASPVLPHTGSQLSAYVNSTNSAVEPTKIRTLQEYVNLRRGLGDIGASFEAALIEHAGEARQIDLLGYCEACGQISSFNALWSAEQVGPNFRESLRCHRCGLCSRLRKVAGYVKEARRADQRDIYLYEQTTPFFSWMRATFPDANVMGSEYLGDNLAGGSSINGVRHEDARSLSFADASFDVVVSCDVFEHVPDIHSTLSEAVRVLRPGGSLIMTIPFYSLEETTVQRATLEHDELIHHLPPQYHGNPISPEGSLVFFDYGWDFLSTCRDAGFRDAYMIPYYSLWHAHLGEGLQIFFVAQR